MTVKQLADVVAYTTSLRGADDMRDGHGTMKHSGTHGGSMEMK